MQPCPLGHGLLPDHDPSLAQQGLAVRPTPLEDTLAEHHRQVGLPALDRRIHVPVPGPGQIGVQQPQLGPGVEATPRGPPVRVVQGLGDQGVQQHVGVVDAVVVQVDLAQGHVRGDPHFGEPHVLGHQVPRDRQLHLQLLAELVGLLDRALAEGLGADHQGPAQELEAAREDLGARGGLVVHQHHHGPRRDGLVRAGIHPVPQPLDASPARALGLEDRPLVGEVVDDARGVQHRAALVAPQVDDHSREPVRSLLGQLQQLALELVGGALAEMVQRQQRIPFVEQLSIDGGQHHLASDDGEDPPPLLPGAEHRQGHLQPLGAADPGDGVGHVHVQGRNPVDMGDLVAGPQARGQGRGVLVDLDHGEDVGALADPRADAAERAPVAGLEVGELALVDHAAVPVQGFEQPLQRQDLQVGGLLVRGQVVRDEPHRLAHTCDHVPAVAHVARAERCHRTAHGYPVRPGLTRRSDQHGVAGALQPLQTRCEQDGQLDLLGPPVAIHHQIEPPEQDVLVPFLPVGRGGNERQRERGGEQSAAPRSIGDAWHGGEGLTKRRTPQHVLHCVALCEEAATVDAERLKQLLSRVQAGELDVDAAARSLEHLPFEDLGFARVDHHRSLRQGLGEVIFGQGKTVEQVVDIFSALRREGGPVLATRLETVAAEAILRAHPDAEHHVLARCVTWSDGPVPVKGRGKVLVVTAGTSDLPVADEAVVCARHMGNEVDMLVDVGVAGIHRLFHSQDQLRGAAVVIVAAGMEGALASVVGGFVRCPVIAVPTSVGYGASLGGIAALLGMLNSCATGVTVVNVDNGFGAAAAATRINRPM